MVYSERQQDVLDQHKASIPKDLNSYRLITEYEDDLDFLYFENFLEDWQCDEIVACYERCHDKVIGQDTDQGFFDGRVLSMGEIPDKEATAKQIMQQARFVAALQIEFFFDHKKKLYSDKSHIVRWPEGFYMPPHADNMHLDAPQDQHRTPHRIFAAVTYLNDDYEGGDIYFPEMKTKVRPKKGLLVAFRGGAEHAHGVTEVTKGTRYTMPDWYSELYEKMDPSAYNIF